MKAQTTQLWELEDALSNNYNSITGRYLYIIFKLLAKKNPKIHFQNIHVNADND